MAISASRRIPLGTPGNDQGDGVLESHATGELRENVLPAAERKREQDRAYLREMENYPTSARFGGAVRREPEPARRPEERDGRETIRIGRLAYRLGRITRQWG